MKAIDKIVDLLPKPLLFAVAALVFLAWLFKELNQNSYGATLRDPIFQVVVFVLCAVVLCYYALSWIFSRAKPFAPNERGVLIAKFANDSDNTASSHTIETLKTRVGGVSEFGNVKIRALDKVIAEEDGKSIVKKQNAVGIITGSYLPPPIRVVHYQLYTRGPETVARVTVDKFPNIKSFEEQFVKQIHSTPTAANLQASTLEHRQAIISGLELENERVFNSLLASSGPAATLPGPAKRRMYVLAIGISNYADRTLRLRYAAHDAQKMANALSKSVGFESTVVSVLVDDKATRSGVLEQLQQILDKAADEDYFYFYFAGHSVVVEDKVYLLPADTSVNIVCATSLDLWDLITAVFQGRSKQALFFFDAMLSGTPKISFGALSSETDPRPAKAVGLMFAGLPGQATIEDEAVGGGLFTHYLVRGIQGAAADANGIVTLSRLQQYVEQSLRQATKDASNPLLISNASPLSALTVAIASVAR